MTALMDERAAALWATLVRRLQDKAGDTELIPWEGGGLAYLEPRHRDLRVETIAINGEMSSNSVDFLNPVHRADPFSVYEIEGVFHVVRNSAPWGKPFKTTDRELAEQVCDRWAEAFPGT